MLEAQHRAESAGARRKQIEQEQSQQEPQTDTETETDSEDFFENSDLPRDITEPAIEITENELQDLEGEDEISLSILNQTLNVLNDLEGNDESYPILPDLSTDLDLISDDL